jgi:spermidine/putrescine transport system substrate-binding protein
MAANRVPRRSFLAAAGLLGGSAALAACTPSGSSSSAAPSGAGGFPAAGPIEEELYMYNWSEYVDPANMEAFKAEFGVKNFEYATFANNDEMLAKLVGGATGYDFACPTADYIPAMVEENLISKLDFSRIPNFQYMDPKLMSQGWDPNNEYHVPKDYGTTGMLVRSKIVTEPVTSWKEFYDLAVGKYSGKVVMVDSLGDVIVMPLKMLGYSLNETDPAKLEEASKLLQDLAPHILALDSDTYQDKLASEEAVLGLGWTGAYGELLEVPETADIQYIVPSEGTLLWMDVWVMMADAPHPNAAYAWFDFIQRPEVQAAETVYNAYATPNLEAKKLVPQEMLDDPAIFPPDDVLPLLEGADPAVTTDEGRLAVWKEFKSSIGG